MILVASLCSTGMGHSKQRKRTKQRTHSKPINLIEESELQPLKDKIADLYEKNCEKQICLKNISEKNPEKNVALFSSMLYCKT